MLSKPHDNQNRDGALIVRPIGKKSAQRHRNVFAGQFYNRCPTVSPRSNNELAVERGIHLSAKGRIVRADVRHKGIASAAATNWPIGITLHAKK